MEKRLTFAKTQKVLIDDIESVLSTLSHKQLKEIQKYVSILSEKAKIFLLSGVELQKILNFYKSGKESTERIMVSTIYEVVDLFVNKTDKTRMIEKLFSGLKTGDVVNVKLKDDELYFIYDVRDGTFIDANLFDENTDTNYFMIPSWFMKENDYKVNHWDSVSDKIFLNYPLSIPNVIEIKKDDYNRTWEILTKNGEELSLLFNKENYSLFKSFNDEMGLKHIQNEAQNDQPVIGNINKGDLIVYHNRSDPSEVFNVVYPNFLNE